VLVEVVAAAPNCPAATAVQGPERSRQHLGPHSEAGPRTASGTQLCRKIIWEYPSPRNVPPTYPPRGLPRDDLLVALGKKNFFLFPQAKINKQKNTPGSRPPGPAGLGTGCVLL
jgi:hypothetical protein